MSERLQQFINEHERIFVLTGAGVSTASGIPDYRDAAGEWKHQRPMEFREFAERHEARQRYWARSFAGWQRFKRARPNPAHSALAHLEQRGRITLTVTQNVDGLHQRAGSRKVAELHGSLATVGCLGCDSVITRSALQEKLHDQNPQLAELSSRPAPDGDVYLNNFDTREVEVPDCEECGGILRPQVVFFGENVPADRVKSCFDALDNADAMLVVGSSLMVYSGLRFVRAADKAGIPVAAVNLGKTRADDLLSFKINEDCTTILPSIL